MLKTKKLFFVCIALVIAIAVSGPVWAEDAGKINLNKASVTELTQLKRVGQKYAQRIVDYREKNGPFTKPEDVMNVQGIGSKTYELNKDLITVE
jgi:competence protein ComEA